MGGPRRPLGPHAEGILAHGDGQAKCRAGLHGQGLHRPVERGILALLARSRHPVRAKLDAGEVPHRGRPEIREHLAQGHPNRGRGVHHCNGRTLCHSKGLTTDALEIPEGDRDIRHGRLPRPHHLVSGCQPTDGAVANGNEKLFGAHRGMPQHRLNRASQVKAKGLEVIGRHRARAGIFMQLGGLAQQHRQRKVDGLMATGGRVDELKTVVLHGAAHHGEGAALSLTQCLKEIQRGGCDGQYIALLGLVAPDLGRREARFIERDI